MDLSFYEWCDSGNIWFLLPHGTSSPGSSIVSAGSTGLKSCLSQASPVTRHWCLDRSAGFRVLLTTLGIWPRCAFQCALMTSLFSSVYWWHHRFPSCTDDLTAFQYIQWPHCFPVCTDDLIGLPSVHWWPHCTPHYVLMTSLLPSMYWWSRCFPMCSDVSMCTDDLTVSICADKHLQRLCFAKPVLTFYLINFQKLLLSSSYFEIFFL